MRHTVRLRGEIVGHSDLENTEPAVGRATGVFHPGPGYDLVRPVFRMFSTAVARDGSMIDASGLERYHDARDALHLELLDDAGHQVHTNGMHIADYSLEDASVAMVLDVLIPDERYWARRIIRRPRNIS